MWRLEKDPYLSSTVANLTVLDSAPDMERLAQRMLRATRVVPRLRQRLQPALGLQPPAWVDDTDFDLSYHLRRLRLHGLIERIPHTNTYTLTPDGIRVAVFYPKVHHRVLRPLLVASDQPPAPIELRRAIGTIDRIINDYATNARLAVAA